MKEIQGRSTGLVSRLLIARALRENAFGMMAIVLPIGLRKEGLPLPLVGLLFTIALLGSSTITILLGRFINRVGRRRVLLTASILWVITTPLLFYKSLVGLVLVALLGSLSPNGKEVGPFLAVEQAVLSRLYGGPDRLRIYSWFNLVGYTSTATGALVAATLGWVGSAEGLPWSFHLAIASYGAIGLVQIILYAGLPSKVEHSSQAHNDNVSSPPLKPSRPVRRLVYTLSALFALDAFGGGFIVQGLLVTWFHARFGFNLVQLGELFFGTNLLSGVSSLAANLSAKRYGLLNTMVFTHLPSNVLLALIPLMPTAYLAVGMLLFRHLFSQMDVPTRQAYTMAVVSPEDRAYMASWTNGIRNYGTALAPLASSALFALSSSGLPYLIAAGLKIVYDLTFYGVFRHIPIDHADEQ